MSVSNNNHLQSLYFFETTKSTIIKLDFLTGLNFQSSELYFLKLFKSPTLVKLYKNQKEKKAFDTFSNLLSCIKIKLQSNVFTKTDLNLKN